MNSEKNINNVTTTNFIDARTNFNSQSNFFPDNTNNAKSDQTGMHALFSRKKWIKQIHVNGLLINIRSVYNKLMELSMLINEQNANIMCLTETWLIDEVPIDLSFNRYIFFKSNRKNKRSGGCAVLLDQNFNSKFIYQLDLTEIQILIVDIISPFNLRIFCIYRSPHSTLIQTQIMNDVFEKFYVQKILIVGDFNVPSINWQGLESMNVHGKIILDFINNFQLTQFVEENTRKNSILDLLIAPANIIKNCKVIDGISDHNIVLFSINKQKEKVKSLKFFRDYNNVNFELFDLEFIHLFNQLQFIPTINGKYDYFYNFTVNLIDKFIPLKKFNKFHNCTEELKYCLLQKKILWRAYKTNPKKYKSVL